MVQCRFRICEVSSSSDTIQYSRMLQPVVTVTRIFIRSASKFGSSVISAELVVLTI